MSERISQQRKWETFKRDLAGYKAKKEWRSDVQASAFKDFAADGSATSGARNKRVLRQDLNSDHLSERLGSSAMKCIGLGDSMWQGRAMTPPRTPCHELDTSMAMQKIELYACREEGKELEIKMVRPEGKSATMYALERRMVASMPHRRRAITDKKEDSTRRGAQVPHTAR